MPEKRLTEQESLLIIQQMIDTAKQEQKDDGKGWIAWGWLLFAVSIFSYWNMHTRWVHTFFFWNWFGFIVLIILLYILVRRLFFPAGERVRTYTKELFNKLNLGFFIFVFFIIVAINAGMPPSKGFAVLIALYGFWVWIFGVAFNFKPSVIAAFITWGCGFAALFVKGFDWVMVCHAAAVLCGFIIPGHMAQSAFKKINRPVKA